MSNRVEVMYIGITESNLLNITRTRSLVENDTNHMCDTNQVLELAFKAFFDAREELMLKELEDIFRPFIKLSREEKRPIWVSVDFIESTIKDSLRKWLLETNEAITEFWHETKEEIEQRLDISIDYTQYNEYGIACNSVVLEGEEE